MNTPLYSVLFLCTGNSARSILAEAALNHLGQGRWRAYSAGSHPTGRVHPMAVEVLQNAGWLGEHVSHVRSKSWDEFARADAPVMDLVITVCDNAAGEVCPLWPGHPAHAHWGHPDPAAVVGDATTQHQAFANTLKNLSQQVTRLIAAAAPGMDQSRLQEQARRIGHIGKPSS